MELRPSYPIATPRLRLRPLTVDDTEELLAYRGRPEVCRYLPFEPMNEQIVKARLAADLGRREIGYVFHPDFAGQGYATEACAAVLDLAFDDSDGLGLHRLVARMDPRNHASVRLASRLGMRREAHFRSNEMFKGAWADLIIYALLASEWHARNDPTTSTTADLGLHR